MSNKQHILIIGYVWPEPNSSAAGIRMMQLIELFQTQGWKITFASAADETDFMVDFESHGIDKVSIEINSSTFDDFIRNLQPSMVLFDRFVTEEQFGWRVAEQCPDAIRILDTEDLHCLRRARHKAANDNRPFKESDLLKTDVAKREIASIYRCDLALIISETEMDLLENVFNIDYKLLHYLPFMLDPIDESAPNNFPDFESRDHFVTIGNFRHKPNLDAVLYLKKEIWPLIRNELPGAELHIYGAYPNQQVTDLHKPDEGFCIKGRAEDAEEVVCRAKVLLAPLRFGAGLKGKLIEAMQCGTPSVTTKIGAEGINGDLEWAGEIAEDSNDFASSAVNLFTIKSAWKKAQKNGMKIINHRFANNRFGQDFIDRISNIQNNLTSHRLQNFTGAILMHHKTASTKYMSKWIEAKNN